MLAQLILAHGEAAIGQGALILLAVGPSCLALLLWWIHPRRWITNESDETPTRSFAVGIAAWLLMTLTTAGAIFLFLTHDWTVLGSPRSSVGALLGLLLPGAVVGVFVFLKLEDALTRWSTGRRPPSIG